MHDRPEEENEPRGPLIPVVQQPRGLGFFFGTWTGRIIVVNTLMFIITVALSDPRYGLQRTVILSSDPNVLLRLGAKDSALLALGEYWRFITPIFIHSGLIHFAFNNWALYAVAFQIEYLLGSRPFLLLYLVSGLAGNVASSLTGVTLSVGASSSLFGLLGFGFYLERVVQSRVEALTGRRPKAGAYTGMVIANLIFGFMIPQIDNSAHLGGLVAGFGFAYIWLRQIPNRLMPLRARQGRIATVLLLLALGAGAWLGSSRWYVLYKLEGAIQSADVAGERYNYLNRYVALDPENAQYRLHRLKLALVLRDFGLAQRDVAFFQREPAYARRLLEMERELSNEGFEEGAAWLRQNLPGKPADGLIR